LAQGVRDLFALERHDGLLKQRSIAGWCVSTKLERELLEPRVPFLI